MEAASNHLGNPPTSREGLFDPTRLVPELSWQPSSMVGAGRGGLKLQGKYIIMNLRCHSRAKVQEDSACFTPVDLSLSA